MILKFFNITEVSWNFLANNIDKLLVSRFILRFLTGWPAKLNLAASNWTGWLFSLHTFMFCHFKTWLSSTCETDYIWRLSILSKFELKITHTTWRHKQKNPFSKFSNFWSFAWKKLVTSPSAFSKRFIQSVGNGRVVQFKASLLVTL